MSVSNLTDNLNNVSALADQPTLSSSELKAVFDRAGNQIKTYINETMIPGIDSTYLGKSGGTISGNLSVTGTQTISGASTLNSTLTANGTVNFHGGLNVNSSGTTGGIELYGDTPYIDFHYGNSSADYTSRLIEDFSGRLTLNNTYGLQLVQTTCGKYIMSSSGARINDDANGNVFILTGANQPIYCRSITDPNNNYVSIIANSFVQASSVRYKENIEDITDEDINKIDDVVVKKFDYKTGDKGQVGVIAEELIDVLPNLVIMSKDENGIDRPEGVNYAGFTPYLIKKCQMQEERINKLEAMVTELLEKNS